VQEFYNIYLIKRVIEPKWQQIIPNGQVNVIELLSEYILSSLPTKVICRDECPGPVELLGELQFVEFILDEGGK